jgi:competence protein ComEA
VKRICVLALLSACWLWSDDDGEAQRLPPGPGKEIIATACTSCHSVAWIREQRLTDDEWSRTIDKMMHRGAQLTDEQFPVMLSYLSKNFGVDSKLLVNSAPAAEFKTILRLTANEADALVQYRETNGAFHSLSDLQKVPKLPWKKIESKQDQLEF